jgi:hypothetical protein
MGALDKESLKKTTSVVVGIRILKIIAHMYQLK